MRHRPGQCSDPAQLSGRRRGGADVCLDMFKSRMILVTVLVCLPLVGADCNPSGSGGSGPAAIVAPGRIQTLQFNHPVRPTLVDGPVQLRGARNEWVSVAVQINQFPQGAVRKSGIFRITPLKAGDSVIPTSTFAISQLLPIAVDT